MVEIQDFKQPVTFDGVKIAVSKSSHVGGRLAYGRLLPEIVTKYVTLTCKIEVVG